MRRALVVSALFATSLVHAQDHSFKPPDGFVPDRATAIAVASAVLNRIYGPEALRAQHPLEAELEGNVWHVQGTLDRKLLGGVAEAWIAKDDGRVIGVIHGQ